MEAFRPPAILREKVERGELGKKSGRGFYDWMEYWLRNGVDWWNEREDATHS